MHNSKLIVGLGVALLVAACNHENDRAMTPANGSVSGEREVPTAGTSSFGMTQPQPTDDIKPTGDTGTSSGTEGSTGGSGNTEATSPSGGGRAFGGPGPSGNLR